VGKARRVGGPWPSSRPVALLPAVSIPGAIMVALLRRLLIILVHVFFTGRVLPRRAVRSGKASGASSGRRKMTKRGKGSGRGRRQGKSSASASGTATSGAVIPLWGGLPDALIQVIQNKLTVHERAKAMLINKRWRDISMR
jgi:hypothetical protein